MKLNYIITQNYKTIAGRQISGYVSRNNCKSQKSLICFRELLKPNDVLSILSCHVETVCLLSNRKPDTKVRVDVNLEDYYRIKDAEKNQN